MASSGSKWSNIVKNSYVKTLILAVIIIGGVMGFWFGLKIGLRSEYPFLAVASGSMEPTLYRGDLIVVQGISNFSEVETVPPEFWNLKVQPPQGDIIVFHSPGRDELIVHRVANKSLGSDNMWVFMTKGDNNWSPDTWRISQISVVGKVVGKVPWVGHIPLNIRTREGIILIVILIVLILLAEYLPILYKKQTEQR